MANEFRVKNGLIVGGDIVPDGDSTRDLGTSSLYFAEAYIDKITTTGVIELGHASQTTLSGSGGTLSVEGTAVVLAGSASHDGFSDFVANEHIDHTSVTLTAGDGLSGGGTIAANRTFAVEAAQTTITSIHATDLIIGEDAQTAIDFGTADEIDFKAANAVQLTLADGVFRPETDSDVDLGTSSLFFKDAFIDKIQTTGVIELGHATDTTIARSSAGVVTIEGETVVTIGKANSVTEPMIKATNAAGTNEDNYLLSYDHATTGFTWVEASSGGASAIDGLSDASTTASSIWLGSTPANATDYNTSLGIGALDALNGTNGTKNVAIGQNAGTANTEGFKNVFIGFASGTANTNADHNVFVGSQSGKANTTGVRNIAIGSDSYNGTTESDNIAIGYDALGGSVNGAAGSVVIGNYAGDSITSGGSQVVIGHQAGQALESGSQNSIVGYNAGYNITGASNTIMGFRAQYAISSSGTENVTIGMQAMRNATGSYNTAVGKDALYAATGNKNIGIGYTAGDNITSGANNVVIGAADVASATGNSQLSISSGDGGVTWITGTSAGSVVIPVSLTLGGHVVNDIDVAGEFVDSDEHLMTAAAINDRIAAAGGGASDIGALDDVLMDATNFTNSFLLQPDSDGSAPTTGTLSSASDNVGIGRDALSQLTSGDHNIVFGMEAGRGFTSGSKNISIGGNTNWTGGTQSNNVAIGYNSMSGAVNGADNNVAIGFAALTGAISADEIVAVGDYAGAAHTSGAEAVYIGASAGRANTTGSRNIAIGYQAYDAADTESDNIAIGHSALGGAVAGGEKNLAIGNYAGDAVTSGDANTLLGYNAGTTLTTGHSNIAIGAYALENSDVGTHNIAIGYEALHCAANSDVDDNVAIGKASLKAAIDGTSGNVAVGINALTLATKDDNVAIGFNAANSITTGERNVFVGTDAGHALEDDSNSVIIGYQAGDNLTAGSGNVIIGCYTNAPSATADGQLVIGTSVGINNPTNWIEGDSTGVITFNHKADVVAVAGNTVLTLAQTGSYVYWTSGTCTLPTSATVGTQFTIFNNTGGSATVNLGTNNAIVSGWTTNAAVADHEATSYICVAATKWIQVG